jgi:hypothetical protein
MLQPYSGEADRLLAPEQAGSRVCHPVRGLAIAPLLTSSAS